MPYSLNGRHAALASKERRVYARIALARGSECGNVSMLRNSEGWPTALVIAIATVSHIASSTRTKVHLKKPIAV